MTKASEQAVGQEVPASHPMAKYVDHRYEPKFDRLSTERRVLGFITPEVDMDALGPRNTFHALSFALNLDDHTQYAGDHEQLKGYLDALVKAGLVTRDGDAYSVTDDGMVELVN